VVGDDCQPCPQAPGRGVIVAPLIWLLAREPTASNGAHVHHFGGEPSRRVGAANGATSLENDVRGVVAVLQPLGYVAVCTRLKELAGRRKHTLRPLI